MIDRLQTLIEFSRLGTMSLVADALRITQPTVSKRLALLEEELGVKLLRSSGRQQTLTPEALVIIEKSQPLISELRSLRALSKNQSEGKKRHLEVGVSDSVLGSWGANSFSHIQKTFSDVDLSLHAHRGPRVVALVESGEYQLGLVAGKTRSSSGVIEEVVGKEEMVIVGPQDENRLLTSEESSLTWNEVKLQVLSQGYSVDRRLESFFAVAQMAKAQMGAGLVPKGVAMAFSSKAREYKSLRPKVFRSVKVIGKKNLINDPEISAWIKALKRSIAKNLK